MIIPRSTIIRQIALGYLVLVLFSLGAVGYSLHSLEAQNQGAVKVVNIDIHLQTLVREMRTTVFALERLERQALILQREDLLKVLGERNRDLSNQWRSISLLREAAHLEMLATAYNDYHQAGQTLQGLFEHRDWEKASKFSRQKMGPLRDVLLDNLDQQLGQSSQAINQTLKELSRESRRAYRIVLVMLVTGLLLAAIVAITVSVQIRKSLYHFAAAIRAIGKGVFDPELKTHQSDEFNQLAQEFQEMASKLREMEQQQLDANPLTRLPGNLAIEREIEERILSGQVFAHGFADLDNFKAFSDRYGYQKGSEVIALAGEIIRQAVQEHGTSEDWVGHIGGDDYIFLTSPEQAEIIAKNIIDRFDFEIPAFYSEEDVQAQGFTAKDRYGEERRFSLLSISIAIVCSDRFERPSIQGIGRECAKMKDHLKRLPGSRFLIDRRKGE